MENGAGVPIIVLANKTDLKWSLPADELEATVLLDWECGYVECSAKDRDSMDMVVMQIMNLGRREGKLDIYCDRRNSNNCLVRKKAFPELPSFKNLCRSQKRKQKKRHSCSIS